MEIRRAAPDDLDAVGAITVAAYAAFTRGPDDPYRERLRDAASRDRQAELWVAVEDGAVLGSITNCPDESVWREVARPGEGEFRMLAVSPQAQGRGVGEALARHVLGLWAGSDVVLSSLPEMTAAHRLYTRLGFVRTPDRDWSPVPGVTLLAFRRDA